MDGALPMHGPLEGGPSAPIAMRRPAPPPGASPAVERLLLVAMPFQMDRLAPLAVALLATLMRRHGVDASEAYLHLDFARLLGLERYRELAAKGPEDPAGELLFARSFHGRPDAGAEPLLERYLEICLARVAGAAPDLVGFSVSFQVLPSLWLARHLKARFPGVRVVFGGPACSAPMGRQLFESYPDCVDHVVSGFGEQPLLDLVHGAAAGAAADGRRYLENPHAVDLDALPIPDYAAFLEQADPHAERRDELMLSFETSRGCWWGLKSHCTFCGLNQLQMDFNAKSADRAVDEIRQLWDRWRTPLFATDTILARSYQRDVLPRLAAFDERPPLFYEVKSNLRQDEVRALAAANVRTVQPGIESLSTPLLKCIGKGVTAIRNLAFLKWCRELGIHAAWNLLCGIPGERRADYEAQIALMAKIPHFTPPNWVSPIRIDRFSPYFKRFREYGWSALEPMAFYRQLHPELDDDALAEIAYHFSAEGADLESAGILDELRAALATWKRRHRAGEGLYWHEAHGLMAFDGEAAEVYERTPALDAVLAASHDLVSVDRLLALPGVGGGFLDELVDEGVLEIEGRLAINLTVRGLPPWRPGDGARRSVSAAEALG